MLELWAAYGFYLWAVTTALVLVALTWLAWTTFFVQIAETPAAETVDVSGLEMRLDEFSEALPHVQATLGRTLQFFGLERYADAAGAQAFALAVTNARGDGYIISSSVRGGVSAKILTAWGAKTQLSAQEEMAIQRALEQREQRV